VDKGIGISPGFDEFCTLNSNTIAKNVNNQSDPTLWQAMTLLLVHLLQ